LARKIGAPERAVADNVSESVEAVRAAWAKDSAAFGYSVQQRQTIEQHMRSVPLLR
jgi:hypothetical protein